MNYVFNQKKNTVFSKPVGTNGLCNRSEYSHPWDSAPLKIETGVWPHLTI